MPVRSASAALLGAVAVAFSTAPLSAQQNVPLPARDNMLAGRPATVFTVGSEEGESWEMFSGIRGLAFDRADNVYILDGQNFRVLVFDGRGRFVRQFGKQGGGPGEFQAPLGIAILSDGNVAVTDVANRGYVIFKPSGEYVRNVTFDDELGMPLGRIEADPRGGIVTRANSRLARAGGQLTPQALQAAQSGPNYTKFIRQQVASAAASPKPAEAPAASELFRAEVPPPRVLDSGAGRTVMMSMQPAFGANPTFGVLPDGGIAVHHDTEYAVKLIDSNGRHTRTLTRAIQPKKVTKKDQEAEIERRKNLRAAGKGIGTAVTVTTSSAGGAGSVRVGAPGSAPPGAIQLNVEDIPFAEYMSVVTNLRTDPLGRIWIQRRQPDGTSEGPIDLVSTAGKYIGTLPPQPLPDALSASGLAAYIVRDDLGVERVSVRRLPATWR